MRIICPNCDAQYEVPDEVIPPEGRDVQCSNCSTTWTHEHPDHPGGAQFEDEDLDETDPEHADEDDPMSSEWNVGQRHRDIDPVVAGILREEALRETAARAREVQPESLEMQQELGLPEAETGSPPPVPASPARQDIDDGEEGVPETEGATQAEPANQPAAADVRPRKDLLPDVEQIHSSLRMTDEMEERGREGPETAARGGFKRGFLFAVLIFVVAGLIYWFAPEIAEAVPESDPWISAYVTWVDDLRISLDAQVDSFVAWLEGLTTPPE